jgi:hypothetical protein
MKPIFIVVLILLYFPASGFAQVREVEYEVYSTIINEVHKEFGRNHFVGESIVFIDHTELNRARAQSPLAHYDLLAKELLRLNSRPVLVRQRFAYTNTYLISRQEFESLIAKGKSDTEMLDAELRRNGQAAASECSRWWTEFDTKYENPFGLFTISRVAFNNSRKTAMVYMNFENSCSQLETVYILKKRKGRWKIVASSGGIGIA